MGKNNMFFLYDLQFFQGEKTEKATPKKRKDAREKGQVVQTKEIGSAISLLLVFLSIQIFIKFIFEELYKMYNSIINYISTPQIELYQDSFNDIFSQSILSLLKLSLPFLFIALITGLVVNYAQVGFLFTMETLKFKLNKLNPLKGMKRLFSLKSVVEMLKSVLKAVGILFLCYNYIEGQKEVLVSVLEMNVISSVLVMWDIVFAIVMRCSIFLLVISIFDFVYKKWENEKNLKMSKQEIKDEYKQIEGDPFIKGKIKEKQRQMAMSRMMQEVPNADVVITNPTHYAVCLKYDENVSEAPKVVAKGKDLIAVNIKAIANDNDVPIIENPPLARSLYSGVDIGDEIPPELYEAVADVLAYIYKIQKRERK